jgi:hypothetical protein
MEKHELAAQSLGWKSSKVMKKSYGKIPDEERTTGLIEAMGLPAVKKGNFYSVKGSVKRIRWCNGALEMIKVLKSERS